MYSHTDPIREEQSQKASGELVGKEEHVKSQSLTPPVLSLKASPIQKQGMEEEELQMKQNPIQKQGEEEEELQMKQNPIQKQGEEEEELQMKSAQLKKSSSQPIQRSAGGTSLPDNVQSQMEQSFGADFSDVNIHANSSSAPEVGALAYTQGNDIHFAQGQYDPGSSKGQELIGHELTHVVQQRAGRVQPTTEVSGMPVNDDHGLENEADQMGRKAAQQKKK
ncbi:MAG: DUF4157 domain-containing protein [Bacteroidota bacterium]